MDRLMSVLEAKSKLAGLVRLAGKNNEIVALTDHGVPTAVLLSIDQYAGLIETVEILSDHKTMRSLRRSMKQVEKGQWVYDSEVFGAGNDR